MFVGHPLVESIIAQGPTKSSVRLRSGIQCDLRVVSDGGVSVRAELFYRQQGAQHRGPESRLEAWLDVESSTASARSTLRSGSARCADRTPQRGIPTIREEADLYRALELDYIPPELRENCGEFEAAAAGKLPRLLEAENLRGTFHCHTTASDGHNTLEEMAAAAQELGLQYLGIADHSRSSIQAHGVDAARLGVQVARIRQLNQEFENFRLFAGVECDILRDGSLDFPDEVLAQLDYVVASIHSAFTLSEADMTRRIIRAMQNPHVTMLAHPTGRLLLKRDPYAVDIPAIIEAAAETGTWIEINAAPKRLDLDWRWWPLAKEKGVKCVINPDAHRTERLQELWFGVGVARKGWLTKEDVMNCLPLGKIEEGAGAEAQME